MFELILKIILTVAILYLTLNTYIKYQVVIDRILLLTLVLGLLLCVAYYDTLKIHEFFLTLTIVIVLGIVLKIVSLRKQKHGYFLFNVYYEEYKDVSNNLKKIANKYEIDIKNINYHQYKPWLIIIKQTKHKQANKLLRELDRTYAKAYRKVSMYNYWYTVVALVLIVAIWRF